MLDSSPKWVRLAPNSTNETLKDQFYYILALKSLIFVPFDDKLAQFGPNLRYLLINEVYNVLKMYYI